MIKKRARQVSIMQCVVACMVSLLLVVNNAGAVATVQVLDGHERIAVAQERVMKQSDINAPSNEMGYLAKGDRVIVLASEGKDYLLVSKNDQTFFVLADQMKLLLPEETFDQPIRARVRADNVNVRSKPSVDAQIVSVLKKGTLVDLNQKSGNWFKISVGHTYGYVSCEYVNILNGEEAKPVYLPLSLGMSGMEVLNLQRTLIKKGYEIDKMNGTYGAQTRDAIKQFQQNNNLVADGIAGDDVQLLLYDE